MLEDLSLDGTKVDTQAVDFSSFYLYIRLKNNKRLSLSRTKESKDKGYGVRIKILLGWKGSK